MGTSSYTSRLETIFNNRGVSQADQETLKGWLTTYSADTILCPPYQLDGGTSTTMLNINALVNNEGAYTNTTTYNSDKKAAMLVETFTAGGVPDVERQQLAVNIVDFMDSNGTTISYNDGANTYYGADKGTPYINEVEAQTSGGRDKYIELYNPYDATVGAGWRIKLDGGATEITLAGPVPAGGYYVIDETGLEGGDQTDANVGNLDAVGEELTLEDNTSNVMQRTDYGSADNNASRQLNDPRPIPLTVSAADPWEWTSASRTSGAENNNFDPTDGDDGWTAVTQGNSFFVANSRFSNKGYLGYIHRGKEWSSVRVGDTVAYPIAYPDLLQYIAITDPSMDNIDNDGDGDIDINDTGDTSFQTGDFDGPEYRIPGLTNVNTAPIEVLESLPNITNAIATAIQGSGSKPFTSIGDMVDDVTQITGTLPKWDEEETLRSISNLITVRSNVFTVYITAQVTDEGETSVFAEKRILAIVDRSVDPIRVRYFRWIVE